MTEQPGLARIRVELDDLRRTLFHLRVRADGIDALCIELHESLGAALADIRSMDAERLQGDLFLSR